MPMKKKSGAGKSGWRGRRLRQAGQRPLRTRASQDAARQTIRRLRSELARALALVGELQETAESDFLLGIRNRRGFERDLARAIAYIKRYHATAALIILDVDRLKPINDNFG